MKSGKYNVIYPKDVKDKVKSKIDIIKTYMIPKNKTKSDIHDKENQE